MTVMGIFKKATPDERTLADDQARLADLKTQLDKANAAEELAADLRRACYKTGDVNDAVARKHANDALVSSQRDVEGLKDAIEEITARIAETQARIDTATAKVKAEEAGREIDAMVE